MVTLVPRPLSFLLRRYTTKYKTKTQQDENHWKPTFIVMPTFSMFTGDIGACHHDNLRYQWRQSWHHANLGVHWTLGRAVQCNASLFKYILYWILNIHFYTKEICQDRFINTLSHRGQWRIYASLNWVTIVWGNNLSPGRCQAFT